LPIINIRSSGYHFYDQPEGVDQNMMFVPFNFLVAIKAGILALRGGLATRTIRTARRRFGQTSLALVFPVV
jgi:hypothetical protein